jgi:ParB-like chromosome segregation protein Spo0J
MPIGQIQPYKKNPRKNEKAVPEVVKSIKEFGFRQPLVVDSSMVLIVGHTRLLAAKELGLASVPVHIASTLTPAQVRAYRIMDNRTHEKSEWSIPELSEELDALFEMDEKYDLSFMDFSLEDLEMEEEEEDLDVEEVEGTTKMSDELSIDKEYLVLVFDNKTKLDELNRIIKNEEVCGYWLSKHKRDPSFFRTGPNRVLSGELVLDQIKALSK